MLLGLKVLILKVILLLTKKDGGGSEFLSGLIPGMGSGTDMMTGMMPGGMMPGGMNALG